MYIYQNHIINLKYVQFLFSNDTIIKQGKTIEFLELSRHSINVWGMNECIISNTKILLQTISFLRSAVQNKAYLPLECDLHLGLDNSLFVQACLMCCWMVKNPHPLPTKCQLKCSVITTTEKNLTSYHKIATRRQIQFYYK